MNHCTCNEQCPIHGNEPRVKLQGTPRSLDQAILNAVYQGASVRDIRAHVMDFLNNKFAPYFLDGHPESLKSIYKLYDEIKGQNGSEILKSDKPV